MGPKEEYATKLLILFGYGRRQHTGFIWEEWLCQSLGIRSLMRHRRHRYRTFYLLKYGQRPHQLAHITRIICSSPTAKCALR